MKVRGRAEYQPKRPDDVALRFRVEAEHEGTRWNPAEHNRSEAMALSGNPSSPFWEFSSQQRIRISTKWYLLRPYQKDGPRRQYGKLLRDIMFCVSVCR